MNSSIILLLVCLNYVSYNEAVFPKRHDGQDFPRVNSNFKRDEKDEVKKLRRANDDEYYSDEDQSQGVAAVVGESVVLDCKVQPPDEAVSLHTITWSKAVKRSAGYPQYVPIYQHTSDKEGALDLIGPTYKGRLELLEETSIKITQLTEFDEGSYACVAAYKERRKYEDYYFDYYPYALEDSVYLEINNIVASRI